MTLAQARDDSLRRQALSHHEDIIMLKAERDQLQRELEHVRKFIQNNKHLSLNNRADNTDDADTADSGFLSSNLPSPNADVSICC